MNAPRGAEDTRWALGAVGHELRSPLSIISGYAELLRVRPDERTRLEASLRIHDAAERLSTIIDEALLLLALGSGELDLETAPVALAPVVRAAVSEIAATHAGHALLLIVDDEDAEVWADPTQLPGLVTRLLDGVCTALPPGTRILVRVGRHDGRGVVAAGAPEQWQLREGARLTLYVVRRLAELHGGSLTIEEETGRVTVTLALPEPVGSDSRTLGPSRSDRSRPLPPGSFDAGS
jgi:signal transduction histidine kinase